MQLVTQGNWFVCPLSLSFLFSLQLTVYLGKRDFVDHLDHVDPVGESLTSVLMLFSWGETLKGDERVRKWFGGRLRVFIGLDEL